MFVKLLNRFKVFELKYVFLRWATGAEYGKINYVGEDYVEFSIIDIDTMEYQETLMIQHNLLLEVTLGGADVQRILAEMSCNLPAVNRE